MKGLCSWWLRPNRTLQGQLSVQDVPRSRLSGARSNVPASQAGSPGSTRPGTPSRDISALPDSPEAAPADAADFGGASAGAGAPAELEVQGSSASLGLSSVTSCAQDSCTAGQESLDDMPLPSHLSQAISGAASRPLSARSATAAGFHQGLGSFKVCVCQGLHGGVQSETLSGTHAAKSQLGCVFQGASLGTSLLDSSSAAEGARRLSHETKFWLCHHRPQTISTLGCTS